MHGNPLFDLLLCPEHGLLRWWPVIVPAVAGGIHYLRRLCAK